MSIFIGQHHLKPPKLSFEFHNRNRILKRHRVELFRQHSANENTSSTHQRLLTPSPQIQLYHVYYQDRRYHKKDESGSSPIHLFVIYIYLIGKQQNENTEKENQTSDAEKHARIDKRKQLLTQAYLLHSKSVHHRPKVQCSEAYASICKGYVESANDKLKGCCHSIREMSWTLCKIVIIFSRTRREFAATIRRT